MRKGLMGVGLVAVVLVASLLVIFQPGNASTGADEGQCPISAVVIDTPQPVPLAACAKAQCGTCPGPNCKIDGICCYVPGTNGAPGRDGVASCGCSAQGEPVCKCDVGQPR